MTLQGQVKEAFSCLCSGAEALPGEELASTCGEVMWRERCINTPAQPAVASDDSEGLILGPADNSRQHRTSIEDLPVNPCELTESEEIINFALGYQVWDGLYM
jgi:hypothetical protein